MRLKKAAKCCAASSAAATELTPARALILAAALALSSGPWSTTAAATPGLPQPENRFPGIALAYAVAVDGRLIWGDGIDTPRPPASLAKLLSAIVLLDSDWDPAARIKVSARAASIEGTKAGLRAGESLTAEDALTALLLRSANDACIALVEHEGADLATFAKRMNARAAALGMRDSNFVNPCGLDAPGQQTTARDLLRLGGAALAQPQIARRTVLARARITTLGGRQIHFTNNNALIGRRAGVLGLKSGFTSKAGKCVIAVAVRNGHHAWVVLLDSPNRWWVAAGLLEEAIGPGAEP